MGLAPLHKHLPASAFPQASLGDDPSQEALRQFIQDFFISKPPLWYLLICGIACGILVCICTVIFVLLYKRLREGSLWLFRSENGVLCPNTLMSFIALEAVYAITFIIWMGLQFGVLVTRSVSPIVNAPFQVFLWAPMWLGGWCANWGTLWAIPTDVLSGSFQMKVKQRWSANACNAFFFGMPAVLFVPVLWSSVEAVQLWHRSVSIWHDFDEAMVAAGHPDVRASPEQLALAITVWQTYASAMYQLCLTWWLWAMIAIINLFGYGLVGGMLIRSLRHHLRRHLELIATNGAAHHLTTELLPGEMDRDQQFFPPIKPKLRLRPKTRGEELKQAVRNMQVHYGATQTVTGVCLSIAVVNAATIQDRVRRSPQDFAFTYQISWAIIAIVTCLGCFIVLLAIFNRELAEPVVFYWRNSIAPNRHESQHNPSPTSSKTNSSGKKGFGRTGRMVPRPATVKLSRPVDPLSRGRLAGAFMHSPSPSLAPSFDEVALLELNKSSDGMPGRSGDTSASERGILHRASWSESIPAAVTPSERDVPDVPHPSDANADITTLQLDSDGRSLVEVEVLQSQKTS